MKTVCAYGGLPLLPSLSSGESRISKTGTPTPKFGAKTYYLRRFFAEDCMKMKEIGPKGVRTSLAPRPLRSAYAICNRTQPVRTSSMGHV